MKYIRQFGIILLITFIGEIMQPFPFGVGMVQPLVGKSKRNVEYPIRPIPDLRSTDDGIHHVPGRIFILVTGNDQTSVRPAYRSENV